jgi:hypothetical protein
VLTITVACPVVVGPVPQKVVAKLRSSPHANCFPSQLANQSDKALTPSVAHTSVQIDSHFLRPGSNAPWFYGSHRPCRFLE